MHELSSLSYWHDSIAADEWGTPRAALGGDIEADVCVIGGGYTGLWTAYYLKRRDPGLRVVVLEAEVVGFGASGRNGGWCSALLPMGLDAVAATSSRGAATALQAAMHATVTEVATVVRREGIDCHFAQGGTVTVARNQPQLNRAREYVTHMHEFGFSDDDYRLLSAAEATERCGATDVLGGTYTPHCAAIHPARLARGLARVVEQQGAVIYEHTPAAEYRPGAVRTRFGTVRAEVVVRATEAFTPAIRGHRRDVAPVYSLMIATEPLPETFWATVGLAQRETFNDGRHMIIYGQRTADDRFAFGGRGAWYHWGSRVRPEHDTNPRVHRLIHETLRELFPSIGDATVTHRWGGAVAAPRDWWCSVNFDQVTGMASAGGYVGDGVGTTNLAGRTLADLITGTDSDETHLPWVGHRSRRWEPEPLRWIGINTMVQLPVGSDRYEARHGTPSRWRDAIVNRLTGGH
ncbi:MAG TPA: FAD-dependent oxidoreductase [Acidimicrobiaceae bacterium]|nr:FAD-dependent oxidoreductase [Acidimicrobiaceae bacterium]